MNKFLKIIFWVAGILVAFLVVLIIGVQLFFPTEKARQYAIEEGTKTLGRPIDIESLDVSFWGGLGVVLGNVVIANPEEMPGDTLMVAKEIDVKLQFWPLLSSEVRADRFIINDPTIRLHKTADGRDNFTFESLDTIAPPETRDLPSEGKASAAAVSFDRIEINRGALRYRNDSTNLTLELTGFDLSTALTTPSSTLYKSSGRLKADTIKITTDEELPSYSIELNYAAGYAPQQQELTIERGDLSLNGLRLQIDGVVERMLDAPTARLSVQTDRVDVADLFALLPPSQRENLTDYQIDGFFSLTVDLEYDSKDTLDPLLYTGTAVIEEMTMKTADIPGELKLGKALVDFKPDNLRLTLENATFDNEPLRGNLVVNNFDSPDLTGELGGNVDLAFVQPFLPGETKHELSGRTRFEITFSGLVAEPDAFEFSGNVKIPRGKYSSELLPEPIDSFEVDVYFDRSLVNVRTLKGHFPSGQLTFGGRINNLVPYMMADSASAASVYPSIDGKLAGTVSLAMAKGMLPEKGAPELEGLATMDLDIVANLGQLEQFRPRGNLRIQNAAYRDSLLPEPITFLEATMILQPDTISVTNLKVKFESSDVAFVGRLINPFPYLLPIEDIDRSAVRRPLFLFKLSSNRFDVDKLFPEAVPGAQEEGTTEVSLDSVSFVFVPDIDGQGTLDADTVIYNKMEFTDMKGTVRIRDRKITVTDVVANLYAGHVTGETTIDLNDFENPKYTGRFKADAVQANEFMERFTPFGGHLFGQLNVSGDYDAVGWEPEQFLSSLSMDGEASMREGTVKTSGAVHQAIDRIAQAVNEDFDKEQTLKQLASKITVDSGRVQLDEIASELGELGNVALSGWYSFDGGLDYDGTITLSQVYTDKLLKNKGLLGGIAGALSSGGSERIALPLKVGGTIDSPKVEIDMAALTREAGKDLLKDAGDKLKGLFNKKKDDKPAAADSAGN